MAANSGVVAYGADDRPYPVVGWYTHELGESGDGGLALQPVVLNQGSLVVLAEVGTTFSIVGLSEVWWDLVNHHNADNQFGGVGANRARHG